MRKYVLLALGVLAIGCTNQSTNLSQNNVGANASHQELLLTQPFLQLPTEDSVRVVWFTEFEGSSHWVDFGQNLEDSSYAVTTRLSRMREDQTSWVGEGLEPGELYSELTDRPVFRHEAIVTGLTPGQRVPYRVTSVREDGMSSTSKVYSLAAKPEPGMPMTILLTSDHQSKDMTPANLQKVMEQVGSIDAVFYAGDLANVPDVASQWFDDTREKAFFPALQGTTQKELNGAVYSGGEIIQNAPLYPVIGNHEVMGIYSDSRTLNSQFGFPRPREVAEQMYEQVAEQVNPQNSSELRQSWIEDNSWNTISYEELFTLPQSESGGETYYAETIGDVRLVSLFVTRIWRTQNMGEATMGKYREPEDSFNDPSQWGYGSFIFEPISEDSQQYQWLKEELASDEFQQAKYKIVMFHHQFHSLGGNVVPAFTDPVQTLTRDASGRITDIRYEYPLDEDYLWKDLEPLLEEAGVDLVLNGHSHLWDRFQSPSGVNHMETSNVGNSYGAFYGDDAVRGALPPSDFQEEYVASGDPYGLEPVMPTIAPLNGQPYISSNEITAFTIFNTETGSVASYYFDTTKPDSEIVKFDEFFLD